jgi:outer membrane protein assembly factor BamB
LVWSFGAGEHEYFFPSAVPDQDGNVYAGNVDGYLYAVGPDGKMLWREKSTDEEEIKPEVVFGPGGAVYFGNDGYYLCRREPDGGLRDIFEADDVIAAAAAVDADGNVFFVADDGYLFAMSSSGRMLWKQEIAVEMKDIFYTSAPAIGPDGTVYVSSWDGGVYAFRGFAPPARTAWPQYRHDAQHTGRLGR